MARRRMTTRSIALIVAAALVVAGCGGGGDEEFAAPDTATPGATGDGTTIGDPGAQPAPDLDGDGFPDEPAAAAELGATASVPDLSGGDIGGGLGTVSGAPLFEAGAISLESLKELDTKDEALGDNAFDQKPDTNAVDPKPAAPTFTGAKVYIDGIVHDVNRKGTFPKDNPVFRLLQVNSTSIEVELIAGEFTTGGGSGVVLDKGELVSLVNASEQLTYRVKFLRAVTGSNGVTF